MTQARDAMLIGRAAGGLLAAGGVLGAGLLAAVLIAAPVPASAAWRPAAAGSLPAAAGSFPAAAGGGGTTLFGVSCTSTAHCMTVGSRTRKGTNTATLALQRTGRRWRVRPTPNPAAAHTSYLGEVSCRRAASCVAIGVSTSKAHRMAALAEAWNGRRWRLTRSAVPAAARSSELFDVSCRGRSGCMAVGEYTARSGASRPFSEHWNGRRWRRLTTPDARRARSAVLDGIFCGGSRCMAVGFFRTTTSPFQSAGLAEEWNGRSWRVLRFPDPAGQTFVDVQDVSCRSRSSCVAVGFSARSNRLPRSLAEVWRGHGWRLVKPPAKAPRGLLLNGVSCPAASDCVAVGQFPTGPSTVQALAAQAWNGARWRTLRTPSPARTTTSFLNQVSCPARRDCVAVGSRGSGSGVAALAESWHGARWRVLPIASP
jgi:hypothetical protein